MITVKALTSKSGTAQNTKESEKIQCTWELNEHGLEINNLNVDCFRNGCLDGNFTERDLHSSVIVAYTLEFQDTIFQYLSKNNLF